MTDPYDNYNGSNNNGGYNDDHGNNNNNNNGGYNDDNGGNNNNNNYSNNSGGSYNSRGGGGNGNGGGGNSGNMGGNGGSNSSYNSNNKTYNQNAGGKKKVWKKRVVPPSKVYLPVTLMFEKTVVEEDIRETIPEVVRWLQGNGYTIRVMGGEHVINFVKGLAPDVVVINHWDGFGDVKCDMSPTKFEQFLAKYIWSWLDSQKDVMATFHGTNITALLGDAYYGRAYAMVTYTDNGILDPQQLTDKFKYFKAPLELADIYNIPVINVGRNSFMDDLQANLHNPNPFNKQN